MKPNVLSHLAEGPTSSERDSGAETEAPESLIEPAPETCDSVLVVDDEEGIRGLISTGLKRQGYCVEAAACGAEARELLRTRRFDLVLCDYDMPGDSGLDLLRYIRDVHPSLPFILLTGHDSGPLAKSAIASGAMDFISKPFEIRQLGRVIEQNWARLQRDRERETELTQEVLTGTIRALVAAVDAKDPHTAQHSQRVTRLAVCLGRAVQLTPERLRVLEFAALLHDVGKIAVPGALLRKPGRLTDEEWIIVRRHPVRSAEIVSQVGHLSEVATIVRHHHERVDGTGYPDGLAGDAIPYLARILTLADAYEAMTADRAYRPALSAARAREIIAQNLGLQFDATLGRTLLDLRDLP